MVKQKLLDTARDTMRASDSAHKGINYWPQRGLVLWFNWECFGGCGKEIWHNACRCLLYGPARRENGKGVRLQTGNLSYLNIAGRPFFIHTIPF